MNIVHFKSKPPYIILGELLSFISVDVISRKKTFLHGYFEIPRDF